MIGANLAREIYQILRDPAEPAATARFQEQIGRAHMNFPVATASAIFPAAFARDGEPRDEAPTMGTRRSMAKACHLVCAALTPVLIVLAVPAAASETRCVRGDDAIRRVEIAVQGPNQTVPCEVVYWKDTEQPGVRNVLWTAQTDADYCARKAAELVDTLEGGGWSCTAAGEQARAASREAAPAAASREAPAVAAPSPPEPRAEPDVAATSPPAAAPAAEGAGGNATAPAVREALAPQRDEVEPGNGATDESPAGAPADTALDAIIEQNLVRLNDGVDGKFAAEIADYGDLDGDGLVDGLVFFTYESQRLGKARFVAAYLFDGESYALAATKPLAGSDDNVHSTEIESIEDGVISLRLNVLEPGDAACCPSGLRRQALVLRGGQLIEARSAADAQNRS
jgi:hypothetical protein